MSSAEPKAEADNNYPDLNYLGLLVQNQISHYCFNTHCFEENNDKHILTMSVMLFLEIMHCTGNLQIS